jgi:hypothetical protein
VNAKTEGRGARTKNALALASARARRQKKGASDTKPEALDDGLAPQQSKEVA